MKAYKLIEFENVFTNPYGEIIDYWVKEFGYTIFKRKGKYLLLPNDKSELYEVKNEKQVINFLTECIESILDGDTLIHNDIENIKLDLKNLKEFKRVVL